MHPCKACRRFRDTATRFIKKVGLSKPANHIKKSLLKVFFFPNLQPQRLHVPICVVSIGNHFQVSAVMAWNDGMIWGIYLGSNIQVVSRLHIITIYLVYIQRMSVYYTYPRVLSFACGQFGWGVGSGWSRSLNMHMSTGDQPPLLPVGLCFGVLGDLRVL